VGKDRPHRELEASRSLKGPEAASSRSDLRSFGRRRGRKLSPRQEGLVANLLPRVSLNLTALPPAPLTSLFSVPVSEVWIEVGFGGGEHLFWQAERNPEVGMIGAEPFLDGVVKALNAIEEQGLRNIRLLADDARPLLRWLPESSISRAFILFPDPWPKRRHAKRRLVTPQLLALLARAMRPNGEVRMATDIADYAGAMLLAVRKEGGFEWLARRPADWRKRGADWPPTRYEAKALQEGRRRYYLSFRRT
jgi:tRNA (guanine-N7-)-methyltransferase